MGRKKSSKKKDGSKAEDYEKDDPLGWFCCFLAFILSIVLLAGFYVKGSKCKLRDVDALAWNDPELIGQIPTVSLSQGDLLFLHL